MDGVLVCLLESGNNSMIFLRDLHRFISLVLHCASHRHRPPQKMNSPSWNFKQTHSEKWMHALLMVLMRAMVLRFYVCTE